MSGSSPSESVEGASNLDFLFSAGTKFSSIRAVKEKEKYHCPILEIHGNQNYYFTYDCFCQQKIAGRTV